MNEPLEQAVEETVLINNRDAEPEPKERQPYSLSDESLIKLGMKEPEEKPVDILNTEIPSKDDATSKKTTDTPEGDKDTTSKPENEETPEEQPSSETEETEEKPKEPSFTDKVLEKIKDYDDEDVQKLFLKDLENWEKFTASNQQYRQELAAERNEFERFVEKFAGDKIQDAISEVSNVGDLKDFLEEADKWFDEENEDPSKNPVRTLIELLTDKAPKVLQQKQESDEAQKRQAELDLREELLDLYEVDPEYKNIDTLKALAKLADDNRISLKTAHQLRMSTVLADQVKEKVFEIGNLKKEIKTLKKELKDRNEKLEKKITSEPTEKETKVGAHGAGVSGDAFKTPSSGFNETEQRLHQKMGVEF